MEKDDLEPRPQPLRPPLHTRIRWHIRDGLDYFNELNFPRVMYHLLSFVYFSFILYLTYYVLPLPGHWTPIQQSDKIPIISQNLNSYFGSFHGFSECNIRALDLYQPPSQDPPLQGAPNVYCPRRKELLEALSGGGRIGFDAPYFPRDCHYRWYSVEEICMILERFDAVVFVGDYSLQAVYNGLSILLRQDLTHGALRTWDMDKEKLRQCSCDNQFTSQTCSEHFLTSSHDLTSHPPGRADHPYLCSRTAHSFLEISAAPAPSSVTEKFKQLVPRVARSNYHPVAIVHGVSPNTAPSDTAIASLEEFLALADSSHRKTPMLWVGPAASGHTEIRGRKGNQEIWDFDRRLAGVAEDNDVDVLRMWNLTVQANSWDGMRFGEKVAITQAMMVLNWLARLPSS
ncbi:uncharacterized protein PV07_12150 [Cladophialophora immunda]|uniref:Uncharacterized protein n=1 Tax=Cladophialophora immunda TaxID=569365 RepID=A0A0D2CF88_9EURO|nr:uncharacterized protein PV07_12150 [Cladophialophora immunda]KIW22244.1 hypothetical protein PV07_12150 [Cladophialophora immunda]OQU99804.1 hypothetical protein CLAIMM_05385 [Cladophialophora immunda]